MKKRIILITGGQRSGKSMYAERLALSLSENPTYIATARVWDNEFKQRILHHQSRRGSIWNNIEEEKRLSLIDINGKIAVIDCITLWCTNFFYDFHQTNEVEYDVDKVLDCIKSEFNQFTKQNAIFIFITNEIGMGGISESIIQRKFTDIQGWFNQYVAKQADEVILMVSGIPVKIK